MLNYARNSVKLGGGQLKQHKLIAWEAPPLSYVKINVDGSAITNPESLSVGGICPDSQWLWCFGFMLRMDYGCILKAELHAILAGLKLAWSRGFKKVIIESDSLTGVQRLHQSLQDRDPYSLLIKECKHLMEFNWKCSVRHVYREANKCSECWLLLQEVLSMA
ncbi:hypothetical protein REPUB_Repub16aG0143600 [Reevesia pubescens]